MKKQQLSEGLYLATKFILAGITAMAIAITIAMLSVTCNNSLEQKQGGNMPDNKFNLSAALPVIGGLADTVIGGIFQGGANRKNRKFAKEMYETQRRDALMDWNMMNEYNSPSAQRQRLKEAGINPMIALSDGGGIMQGATVRSAEMGNYDAQPLPGTQLGQGMAAYQQTRLMNAQIGNVEAQTEVARQDAMLKLVTAIKTIYEGEHSNFDLARKNELKQIIFEKGVADLNLIKAQIDQTVHGNQRAQDLHSGNLTGQRLENAEKQLRNVMQQMQNKQYEQMRPLELAKAQEEINRLKQEIRLALQQTKNEHEKYRLNKMDADAGKVLGWIKTIIGGRK